MVREVLVTLRHHCRRLFLTRRRLEENRERENLRGDKSSPQRFRQAINQGAGDWKDGVGGSPHLRGFARLIRLVGEEEVLPGYFARSEKKRFRQVFSDVRTLYITGL
jgi:hypothetical protein